MGRGGEGWGGKESKGITGEFGVKKSLYTSKYAIELMRQKKKEGGPAIVQQQEYTLVRT